MNTRYSIALTLAVVLGLGAGVALSAASRRPARAILSELDALKMPSGILDDESLKLLLEVCRQRTDLEQELFDTWPEHARVPKALEERWALLENTFHEHERVLAETEQVLAHGCSPRLSLVARRARAWTSVNAEAVAADECVRRIDAARLRGTDDDRTAAMLVQLAAYRTADPELQQKLCRRVLDAAGLASESKQDAQNWLSLVERVGRPLSLDFDDAESGAPASIAGWMGSPILLYVRRASDWEPLEERDLRPSGCAVVQVMIGKPAAPGDRFERCFVAPDDWDSRFGIRKTPLFLLADAAGALVGISQSREPLENELRSAATSPAKRCPCPIPGR